MVRSGTPDGPNAALLIRRHVVSFWKSCRLTNEASVLKIKDKCVNSDMMQYWQSSGSGSYFR